MRAKIEVAEAFSGHADNTELMQWLRKIAMPSGGRLAIVHSEPDRAEKYLTFVKSHLPEADIVIPKIGSSIEV